MDFKQFRDTGELSDISVTVSGKTFKLHKFPLYIRSEYFKELFQGGDHGGSVELKDFPGGADIFNLVADFCYNIDVDITRDNVCQLRCAAEYLQMKSPGNLADRADRCLDDFLASSRLNRSVNDITDLMVKSFELNDISEQAGVIDRCNGALVESWLKPSSKFTSLSKSQENQNLDQLSHLPLNWFVKTITSAQEKSVNTRIIVAAVERYITKSLQRASNGSTPVSDGKQDNNETMNNTQNKADTRKDDDDDRNNDKPSTDDQKESIIPTQNKAESNDDVEVSTDDPSQTDTTSSDIKSTEADEKADKERGEKEAPLCLSCQEIENWSADLKAEIKEVIDTLLELLPGDAPFVEVVSASWVVETLKAADVIACDSRELLINIASKLLQRFAISELVRIRPSVLCEVIQKAVTDPENLPGVVSGVLDNYLLELAQNDQLPVNDFRQLGNVLPPDYRPNHDALFQVLELILQTGRVHCVLFIIHNSRKSVLIHYECKSMIMYFMMFLFF